MSQDDQLLNWTTGEPKAKPEPVVVEPVVVYREGSGKKQLGAWFLGLVGEGLVFAVGTEVEAVATLVGRTDMVPWMHRGMFVAAVLIGGLVIRDMRRLRPKTRYLDEKKEDLFS